MSKLVKVIGKFKKIGAYVTLFVFVFNGASLGVLVPEAKASHGATLVINEVMPRPSGEEPKDEWIEIYNPSDSLISLDGLTLNDEQASFSLYGNISANGYRIFYGLETGLALKNTGELITLNEGENLVDAVDYENANPHTDESYARTPNGSENFTWTENTTPEMSNDPEEPENGTPSTPELVSPDDNQIFTETEVTLEWVAATDPENDPISYNLEIDGNVTSQTEISYTNTFLQGTHTWRVQATDVENTSEWSLLRTFTIDSEGPLNSSFTANPNTFSPDGNGVMDETAISAEFNEELSGAEINIYDADGNPISLLETTVTGNAVEASWDGTTEGEVLKAIVENNFVEDGLYTAKIIVTDIAGNESEESVIEIEVDTTGPDPTSGSAFQELDGDTTNNNNPTVTGNCSSDTSSVLVEFQTQMEEETTIFSKEAECVEGIYSTEGVAEFTVQVVPVITVLPDGVYIVTSAAKDELGNVSGKELIIDGLTIDTTAPESAPLNLTVKGKSPNSITLNWDASEDEDIAGYMVYRGTEDGVFDSIIPVGNVTSYVSSGLNANKTYYFKVTSYDKAMNESEVASFVSDTTPAEVVNTETENAETPTVVASTDQDPPAVKKNEKKGIVESVQAAAPQEIKAAESTTEESKKEEKKKNKTFAYSVLFLILGTSGYYFYNLNREKVRNYLKFPRIPDIKE